MGIRSAPAISVVAGFALVGLATAGFLALRSAPATAVVRAPVPHPAPTVAAQVDLPHDGAHPLAPQLSPTGHYIVYEADRYGVRELVITAADGGDRRVVRVPEGGREQQLSDAAWHPSGVLVFSMRAPGRDQRLYLYTPGEPAPELLVERWRMAGNLGQPAVSADGAHVAFTSGGDLIVRGLGRLSHNQLTSSHHTDLHPAWSSTAERVAFTRRDLAGDEDVRVVDVASGHTSAVAVGNGDQTRPVWAAGDRLLWFAQRATGSELLGLGSTPEWDLVVADEVGAFASRRVLAEDVALPASQPPALSPDGRTVAYAHVHPGRRHLLGVVGVEGGAPRTIDTGLDDVAEVSMGSKDGRVIAVFTARDGTDPRAVYRLDVTDYL